MARPLSRRARVRAALAEARSAAAAAWGRAVASPLAKVVATEMRLEVSAVAGTGPGGSITAADVLDAAPGAGVADVFVRYYRGVRARVLELPKYRTTGALP